MASVCDHVSSLAQLEIASFGPFHSMLESSHMADDETALTWESHGPLVAIDFRYSGSPEDSLGVLLAVDKHDEKFCCSWSDLVIGEMVQNLGGNGIMRLLNLTMKKRTRKFLSLVRKTRVPKKRYVSVFVGSGRKLTRATSRHFSQFNYSNLQKITTRIVLLRCAPHQQEINI